MKHSKIFTTEQVRAILDGRMTAFYERVNWYIPPYDIETFKKGYGFTSR